MLNRQPTVCQQINAMYNQLFFSYRSLVLAAGSLVVGVSLLGFIPAAFAAGDRSPHVSSIKQASIEGTVNPGLGRGEEPPLIGRNTETVLDEIQTILAREEPPLGSRGAVCAISPGLLGTTDIIWSDRPLFLWQGAASQITLYTFDTQAEVWNAPLEPGTQAIAYAGEELLQLGQVYAWTLSDGAGTNVLYIFEVMGTAERSLIAAEVQALETQLKASNTSDETIAAERARYFAERDLWSDVLESLYQIETPSESVNQTIQEISDRVCVN